ncbi:hypothetical protein ACQPUL_02395 [Clostridium butyricum]
MGNDSIMKLTQEELEHLESLFDTVKKPDKYIIILNSRTYAETLVNVYDT